MKFSVVLGNLGNTNDRFLSSGYKEQPTKAEMVRRAAAIEGVEGIELVGSWDVTPENVDEVGDLLSKHKLKCVSIIPDLFAQKRWGNGSLSSKNASIRSQALEYVAKMAEAAQKLNCGLINLWPGQDGYDYPLQADYRQERLWMEEAIRVLCVSFPGVKFSLEYKPKEPRTHSYMARCGDTLLMSQRVGKPNVGVTVDIGHSFNAGENVSEAVVMLAMADNRLFHVHCNDNYRSWDDDMIVGSVHFVEYVELLFWLREVGYTGWCSMDQYPYREDAEGALRESIEFIKAIDRKLDDRAMGEIRQLIRVGDATRSTRWIREKFLA